MNNKPSSAAAFRQELADLRQKFQAMTPELEVTVRDPAMGVEGFVVVWNTGISKGGPMQYAGKGGTRVTKTLTLDDVKRLARAMAEKNAAAGLPMGGAKSGLRLDPADPDYEKKYRRFAELCAPLLHERGGIFGGFGYDVGCIPPKNAIWACDQLKSARCFTGKPVEMGGTDYDREGIAGLGVAVAGRTLIEENGQAAAGKTFAVQGAGAMGAAVVRYFSEYGGVLQCVSDPKYGGTWQLNGKPSAALVDALSHQKKDIALDLLPKEGKKISDDSADALYATVDIIFPCAVEDVLRKDNADRVQAKFMAEGANNPTTAEAHEILFKKGVKVVPDIIANPGGIIAAFVELTSKVSPEENVKTRGKVTEAKEMTVRRVSENVKRLVSIVNGLGVEADQAGDYMAYCNIFYGLK
jgi:glutamate dehydrogenase (NAD(P)+)